MVMLKLYIGNWKFVFGIMHYEKVVGVNSRVKGGGHILMWDFDNQDAKTVVKELARIQRKYNLPPIYILETNPNKGYIAYCFKRVSYQEMIKILADTNGICPTFLRMTAWRMHATLRVSPKSGRRIKPFLKLPSGIKEDVTPKDLISWVEYETLTDNSPKGMFLVGKAWL